MVNHEWARVHCSALHKHSATLQFDQSSFMKVDKCVADCQRKRFYIEFSMPPLPYQEGPHAQGHQGKITNSIILHVSFS